MIKPLKKRKNYLILTIVEFVVLSIIVSLFPACSLAGHRSPTPKVPTLLPKIQGLYESCSPSRGANCLDRLKQMASAGFTLVVNYDQLYGSAEQQLAYARQDHGNSVNAHITAESWVLDLHWQR